MNRFELRPVHVHDNELAHVCHEIIRPGRPGLRGWRCDSCMEALDEGTLIPRRAPGDVPPGWRDAGLSAGSDAQADTDTRRDPLAYSDAGSLTNADCDAFAYAKPPAIHFTGAERAELPADPVRSERDVPERFTLAEFLDSIAIAHGYYDPDERSAFACGYRIRRAAADDDRRG